LCSDKFIAVRNIFDYSLHRQALTRVIELVKGEILEGHPVPLLEYLDMLGFNEFERVMRLNG
jgi:hypothetical protein